MTDIHPLPGDCHVQLFLLQTALQCRGLQLFRTSCKFFFNLCSHRIGQLTNHRPLLGRKASHAPEYCGQLSFFAQIPDAQSFNIRVRCRQSRKGFFLNFFQFFFHNLYTFLNQIQIASSVTESLPTRGQRTIPQSTMSTCPRVCCASPHKESTRNPSLPCVRGGVSVADGRVVAVSQSPRRLRRQPPLHKGAF